MSRVTTFPPVASCPALFPPPFSPPSTLTSAALTLLHHHHHPPTPALTCPHLPSPYFLPLPSTLKAHVSPAPPAIAQHTPYPTARSMLSSLISRATASSSSARRTLSKRFMARCRTFGRSSRRGYGCLTIRHLSLPQSLHRSLALLATSSHRPSVWRSCSRSASPSHPLETERGSYRSHRPASRIAPHATKGHELCNCVAGHMLDVAPRCGCATQRASRT